ncbi:MAG TPA: type II toxin-antitoxin system prevent-host-death family antitoxin [Solirubrobacteraceae bacterium]|nr:type II toxin-antitoxin system prevent-host-death family antitoxin [Solirubrobacteraceae bacterium]
MPTTIPQRELRNQIGAVLRRAERGERFTITVGGRPAAELGPLTGSRTPAAPNRLAAILAEAPADAKWAAQLRQMRDEDIAVARDPWAD